MMLTNRTKMNQKTTKSAMTKEGQRRIQNSRKEAALSLNARNELKSGQSLLAL